ncbi:hypothetical protein PFMALIP_05130 [Plasmodium falciparum MaliPS096_E11]|uniref:Uncharacterized protein n=1 Tax=Plasmodium falciparum MaliPS096_E11 TaxID=1036727 RepID=A0A024WI09_PLAFA|nr:hypothetical protein PFMALIP_05130 [Plasmodium falciparum MaliPS096_E11]
MFIYIFSYRMNSHPYACNREVTFKEET